MRLASSGPAATDLVASHGRSPLGDPMTAEHSGAGAGPRSPGYVATRANNSGDGHRSGRSRVMPWPSGRFHPGSGYESRERLLVWIGRRLGRQLRDVGNERDPVVCERGRRLPDRFAQWGDAAAKRPLLRSITVATSVATSRSSITSRSSTRLDDLDDLEALDRYDTRVTGLRAWSGITGWRFESSSAHRKALHRGAFRAFCALVSDSLAGAWQLLWQPSPRSSPTPCAPGAGAARASGLDISRFPRRRPALAGT
jgi:hypothetical protein